MAVPKAKEIVSSNVVVVFSKSYCPFCSDVKKLLGQVGASFKTIELNVESDGSEIQSALAEWTGQRTVPNVFIGGKHIGGCDVTTGLQKEGKLVPLLTEAGAVASDEQKKRKKRKGLFALALRLTFRVKSKAGLLDHIVANVEVNKT